MGTTFLGMVVCLAQLLQAPGPADDKTESLDVRYAQAQLQLAEANLSRIQQSNQRVPRSVPESVVAEYRDDVTVAQARLDQATAGQAANEFQGWLERAATEQRAAEALWTIATTANSHLPGTFDALDVERYRLRAEVARLQFERGQALIAAAADAQMQWKIEMLDNQVQRLKEEARLRPAVFRAYPYWLR
jgi:hypothetical protein